MPRKPIAEKSSKRDLRIDFFRGVVLLVILIEHIEWQTSVRWLVHVAPHVFGPIDALDIFVFLSGYVFGLVYRRVLVCEGFWLCYRKALWRAWQLYIANNAIFLFVLVTILLFSWERADFVQATRFSEAMNQPMTAFLYALALAYQPYNFDILPLYIVLLAVAPIILTILSQDWRVGLLVSYSLYAVTQLYPSFNFPLVISGREQWIFNPLSWQLLFAIAMTLSDHREHKARKTLDSQWVLWISIILVIAITTAYLMSENYTGRSTRGVLPWIDKTTLGPLRLLYFLCLVRIASFYLPATAKFWHARIVSPIVHCGQHSLPVFCLGVILTYICLAWQEMADLSSLAVKLIESGAIVLSMALAYLLICIDQHDRKVQ